MPIIGVDTSHHLSPIWRAQGRAVPTLAEVRQLYEWGVRFWIMGLQDHNVFLPTIERLLEHGNILVEDYTYLYNSRGPITQMEWGMGQLDRAGLLPHVYRHWHDHEEGVEQNGDGEVKLAHDIEAWLKARGLRGGMYTANWWWTKNVSPAGYIGDIDQWTAYWNNVPDMAWVPYGGVARFHTKQYGGDKLLLGFLNCDLNVRPDDIWQRETGGLEEDDLADPQKVLEAISGMNRAQLGALNAVLQQGVLPIVDPPNDASLLAAADHPQGYHKKGDLTRGLYDHALKRAWESSGGDGEDIPEIVAEMIERTRLVVEDSE